MFGFDTGKIQLTFVMHITDDIILISLKQQDLSDL
jgi:hypothetical protein